MAYAITGGKINIFSPKIQNNEADIGKDSTTQTLNVNKEITCICFGNIKIPEENDENMKEEQTQFFPDYLFIGCETSLMCYDLNNNKTIYFKINV